jgi:hypothetical protein
VHSEPLKRSAVFPAPGSTWDGTPLFSGKRLGLPAKKKFCKKCGADHVKSGVKAGLPDLAGDVCEFTSISPSPIDANFQNEIDTRN